MDWNKSLSRSDLCPGDHVCVTYPDGSTHHGIFIGEETTDVIHFWQAPKPSSSRNNSETSEEDDDKEPSPLVQSCSLGFFQYLARSPAVSSGSDLPSLYRYKYSASRLETRLIKSNGSCTTSLKRPAPNTIALARWFLANPNTFGAFLPSARNSEHFAVYCCTTEQTVPHLSSGEEPKVPEIVSTADAYLDSNQATAQKSRVALAAGATCGVLAAGTLWGLAPAVAIGGAVYATAKYVKDRGTIKEEERKKKND